MAEIEFKDLVGKTMAKVEVSVEKDEILFETTTGEKWKLYHDQNCCESVTVEDVIGDLNDLVGAPIIMAEEATSGKNPDGIKKEYQDSYTWTFYKLATKKGYVTIRWYGESNGYYSESVSFDKVN